MWSPGSTSTTALHCTQVSSFGTPASSAASHAPPSTATSTAAIPVCCDQAIPANVTCPTGTSSPERGTSIRDDIFTGPISPQPLSVQNALIRSNRVTSMSTTHLQADT